MSQTTPAPWRPEDQRSWEELERRAAAQAKEFSLRAPRAPEPPPPAPPPPPEPPKAPAASTPPQAPPPEPPGPVPKTAPGGAAPQPAPAKKKFLGRFSGDQLLLAALLFLLIQEEAEPQLILAVAYILFS